VALEMAAMHSRRDGCVTQHASLVASRSGPFCRVAAVRVQDREAADESLSSFQNVRS